MQDDWEGEKGWDDVGIDVYNVGCDDRFCTVILSRPAVIENS